MYVRMNKLPVKLFITIEYDSKQAFIMKDTKLEVVNDIYDYNELKSSIDPLPESLERIKTMFVNDILSVIPYALKSLGMTTQCTIDDTTMLCLLEWLSKSYEYTRVGYRLNGYICVNVFNDLTTDEIFEKYFYFKREDLINQADVSDDEKKYNFEVTAIENKRHIVLL